MMMRIGLKHIVTALTAAAVAATISAAPMAAAAPADDQQPNDPQGSCTQRGDVYKCERGLNVPGRSVEGNVQLNDPPTANDYYSIFG
jgi:hypothetical protein